ncbi:hypothetical protein M9Y10_002283 [Tritrichomonas musculus]|uniref:TOG domain-containing protein n=1 Tax=Tritrichomonas musculus TaxID=1915356 RepID=A0ABR2LC24_9EUKA
MGDKAPPAVTADDDTKAREASYSHVLEYMANPSPELLDSLRLQLPRFLCDTNPTCQRIALNICEQFFRHSTDINYAEYADILIHKSFIPNPEQTMPLLEQCFKADYDSVSPLVYENITSRPPDQLKLILAIVISYLATLTLNTSDKNTAMSEVEDIIKHITPLTKNKDESISKEAIAAIDSAKIVSQSFQSRNMANQNTNDTTNKNNEQSSDPNHQNTGGNDANSNGKNDNSTNENSNFYSEVDENGHKISRWAKLVHSENWKERKEGYTILLSSLNTPQTNTNNKSNSSPSITMNEIDHDFYIAGSTEKHIACLNLVLEVIESIAHRFKTQMSRKLREYLQVVINLMSQRKNPRLTNLQSSFDAIATNAVSSPYEPPFVEHLIKMMTSSNIRLKEESLQFISRTHSSHNYQKYPQITEQLTKLTSDPSQFIRETATALINPQNTNSNNPSATSKQQPGNNNNTNDPSNNGGTGNISTSPSQSNRQSTSKSPDPLKRTLRRKSTIQMMQSMWTSWINPESLQMLNSVQWLQVTKGLELLRKQYDGDKSCRSAVVTGLTSLFTGRTFTPKVMTNLFQNILFYLQDNNGTEKLNEESILSTINFCVDKIVDKHFESNIFEILSICCDCTSSNFVYDQLFPHVSCKNPVVVSRVVSFFAFHIEKSNTNNNSNNNSLYLEVSNQIKPLFTHGDPNVRKASTDCAEALVRACPKTNFNFPTTTNQSMSATGVTQMSLTFGKSSNNTNANSNKATTNNNSNDNSKAKENQLPNTTNPTPNSPPNSNNTNTNTVVFDYDGTQPLIPQKLIIAVGKTSSFLDCKKGLEDLEALLTEALKKLGMNSVQPKEFIELFNRVRPWFKDSNTNVVFSVSKVVLLSLKLISKIDENISNDFLGDIVLLLNFVHKGIRSTTLQMLERLNELKDDFIPTIFIPSFYRLNVGGRKVGITFIRDLQFDMQVDDVFTPFIVNILADKSEDFRNAALPIVQHFLTFEGASDEIIKEVDQFPPAKKNLIISLMSGIEAKEISYSLNGKFSKTCLAPQRAQTSRQVQRGDQLEDDDNDDDYYIDKSQKGKLGVTGPRSPRPFTAKKPIDDPTDPSPRTRKLSLTMKTVNQQPNSNGSPLGNNGNTRIPVKKLNTTIPTNETSGNGTTMAGTTKIPIRKSSEDSSQVRFKKPEKFNDAIRRKSEEKGSTSSIPVFKKDGTGNNEFPVNQTQPQPQQQKQQVIRSTTQSQNQPQTRNDKLKQPQNQTNMNQSQIIKNSSSNDDIASSLSSSTSSFIDNSGTCRLNDALTQKISDPSIYVYQWIADLNSSDINRISLSTKAILKNLKGNSNVFVIHTEALSASLVFKLHSFLLTNPIPESIIKSISLCLFHIFTDPKLYKKVPKEYVQQIVVEICVHYKTSEEKKFSAEFTNLMGQMIESVPLFTFSSLLLAIGELNVKWIFIALKFFDKCGEKIMLIGNSNNAICKSLLLVDKFFVVHPRESILNRNMKVVVNNVTIDYSTKTVSILENFIAKIGESFTEIVDQKETMNKFPQNSTVLPLLEIAKKKKGAPTIPAPGANSNISNSGNGSNQLRGSNSSIKSQQQMQQKVRISFPNS